MTLPLALAWVLLVAAGSLALPAPSVDWVVRYFWPPTGHWTPAGARLALARDAAALAALAAADLAAWGPGVRLLAFIRSRPHGAVRGAAAVALGLAALGLAAWALALAGLAFAPVLSGVAAAGWALFRRAPGRRAPPAGAAAANAVAPLVAGLAGVLVLGGLLGALAPEVTEDALRHFLGEPRRMLALHRWLPVDRWPLTWTPPLAVAVNLPVLALGGEAAVRLLSWQAWVAIGAVILAWGRRPPGRPVTAALAGLAWLAGVQTLLLGQVAWADCGLTAWITLAACAQFALRMPRLAGLCWAGAAATKSTAAWYLAGAAGAEAWMAGPAAAGRLLLPALALNLPWLARNALAAGNPLAPFLMPEDGGVRWLSRSFVVQAEWAAGRTWRSVLAAPWTVATGRRTLDGTLSPLVVMAFPAALAAPLGGAFRTALAATAACWAWFAGYGGRYALPLAPVVLVAGAAWLAAATPGRRGGLPAPVRWALLGWIGWEAAVSIALAFHMLNPAGVALGHETAAVYRERALDPAPWTARAGAELAWRVGPRDGVLVCGRAWGHGWPGVTWADAEGLPPRAAAWAAAARDATRIGVLLRQRGVRWIVEEEPPPGPGPSAPDLAGWTPAARGRWAAWRGRHAPAVARVGDARLAYVIRAVR